MMGPWELLLYVTACVTLVLLIIIAGIACYKAWEDR